MVKKALLIILFLMFVFLTSCESQTLQGIGGDIKHLGGGDKNKSDK